MLQTLCVTRDTLCNNVMHGSKTQTALTVLQALQEALKYVQKSQKSSKQAVIASLTRRTAAITAFLQAQQFFGSDAASAVQMCNGLIVEVRILSSSDGHTLSLHQVRAAYVQSGLDNPLVNVAVKHSTSAEPWGLCRLIHE